MFDQQTWAFIGVIALLTITPGADVMLIIRSTLSGGRQRGFLTTTGICLGLLVHATLSVLGVSLILVRSAAVFSVVKFIGACYLVFLGGQSIWRAGKNSAIAADDGNEKVTALKVKSSNPFLEGFFTNLLNPKVAAFYLALLPQFIGVDDLVFGKSMLLAGIHNLMTFVWLSLLALLMDWLDEFFKRPGWQRGLQMFSGLVLVFLGIRLALERA